MPVGEDESAAEGPAGPGDGFEAFYRADVDRVFRALAVTLRRDDLAREAVDEAMARAYALTTFTVDAG